jgi:FAD/FMN-containing dehydrogenase
VKRACSILDGGEPGALARAEALDSCILRTCVGMGGSHIGEHGIGMEKRDHLPEVFIAAGLALCPAGLECGPEPPSYFGNRTWALLIR